MEVNAKLLALALCVLQFYNTAAQVDLGFEQVDYAVREGRTGSIFLRTYVGTPSSDIELRLIPLTVDDFATYQTNNPTRTFASTILTDVGMISNPAEYEQVPGGRRDFNNTVLSIVFPASSNELEVQVTESLIFDDDINEFNEEGFVIVLEIENDPSGLAQYQEGRDVLVFNIFDNDEIRLGFEMTSFTFAESIGVLSNTFNILKLDNQISEVDITIIVNLLEDSSNPPSATQDEDFRPVSDGSYMYEIEFSENQQTRVALPIEIINDLAAEQDESFILSLSPGPDAATLNYQIPSSGRIVTVLITDNDRVEVGFDNAVYSVTEGTDSTVEVCFSTQQGMFGSSSTSLLANITQNMQNTASLMEDYELPATPHQITLSSAQSSACFTVTIIDDSNTEATECVTLRAVNISANVDYEVLREETQICIADNDDARVGFSSVQYITSETDMQVQVTLAIQSPLNLISGPVSGNFIVSLSAGGTALASSDFGNTDFTQTLDRNNPSADLSIPITDDLLLEGNETFFLTLTAISGSLVSISSVISPDRTEIVIQDNDELTVELLPVTSVTEGMSARVCVQATSSGSTNGIGQDFTVSLQSTDMTALRGGDFNDPIPFDVTFSSGTSVPATSCIDVPTIDDDIWEGPQDFLVAITAVTNSLVSIGATYNQTVEIIDNEVATVSFTQSAHDVTEGDGSVSVCVTISLIPAGGMEQGLTVSLEFTSGSLAVSGQDFQPSGTQLTFPTSSSNGDEICRSVIIIDDGNLEGDHPFTVTITGVSPGRGSITPTSTTTITIHDNHEVTATLQLQPSNMFMEDVGTVEACVVIAPSDVTETSLTVDLRSLDGSATNPEDYSHSDPLQVTFTVGTTGSVSQCVDISIVEDNLAEGDHDFTTEIMSTSIPSPVVMIGTPSQQTATIQDNDDAIIGLQREVYSVTEGGSVEVVVLLLSGILDGTSIQYTITTSPGTATANTDYSPTASPSSGTISASNTQSTHTFMSLNDNNSEAPETFFVDIMISGTTPSSLSATANPNRATVRIIDNDALAISFEQPSYTVTEGTDTQVRVCVQLTGQLDPSSDVDITVSSLSDTATVMDYDASTLPAQATFTHTNEEHCYDIMITDDPLVESNERFFLEFSITGGADVAVMSDNRTEIVILDNDVLYFGFGQALYQLQEGDGLVDNRVYIVKENFADIQTNDDITVSLTITGGSATSGGDYTVTSSSFVFGSTSEREAVPVNVFEDMLVEGEENFMLSLTAARVGGQSSSGAQLGSQQDTQITIQDNDVVTIGFVPSMYTVHEDDTVIQMCIQVISGNLAPGVSYGFNVVTVADSASDSTDFVMLMENSVVSDGSLQICYDVSILDDDQIEPSESFYATITAQPGPIQSLGIINPSQSSVLIIDNDDLRVGFEMDQYTFSESAGQVTIHIIKENTVSISENFIVQVAMLQSSTATEDLDYSFSSGSLPFNLTFNPADSRRAIDLEIINDQLAEGDETISLQLNSFSSVILIGQQTTMITVQENDVVTVGFSSSMYTVVESAERVEVCVRMQSGSASLPSGGFVTFSVSITPSTAAIDDFDVSGFPMTGTIDENNSQQCFSISITDDKNREGTETFTVRFDVTNSQGNLIYNPISATVSILDDDILSVGFEMSSYRFSETSGQLNSAIMIVKENDIIVDEDFVVRVNLLPTGQTAQISVDYSLGPLPLSITFAPSDNMHPVPFEIIDDIFTEENETFTLSLSLASPSQSIQIGQSTTQVTIEDDDTIVIGFEEPWYTVFEGTPSVEVCVAVVQGFLASDVTLRFNVRSQQAVTDFAVAPSDYTVFSETRSITSNAMRQCFAVAVVDDDEREHPEKLLAVGVIVEGDFEFTPAETEVWIIDDSMISPTLPPTTFNCSLNECEDGPTSQIVTCDTTGGPLAKVYCSYDGSPLQACTLPVLIDLMEFCEGLHIIEITVLNEDNRYVSDRIEFTGGLSGLSFELTCTVEELPDEEVSITCETDRVLESLTCFVDDEPPQPCALEQVFDTSRYSGTHTLTISAIDLQGRIAQYTYTTVEKTPNSTRSDDGFFDFNDREIADIVLGSVIVIIVLVILLLLLLLLIWCLYRRRREKEMEDGEALVVPNDGQSDTEDRTDAAMGNVEQQGQERVVHEEQPANQEIVLIEKSEHRAGTQNVELVFDSQV